MKFGRWYDLREMEGDRDWMMDALIGHGLTRCRHKIIEALKDISKSYVRFCDGQPLAGLNP